MIEKGKTTTSDRKYRHSKTLPDLTSWHQPDHRKHPHPGRQRRTHKALKPQQKKILLISM